jgi:hypothetical protein
MNSVLIISTFEGNAFAGGGEKRSFQIKEILKNHNINFISYNFVPIAFIDIFRAFSIDAVFLNYRIFNDGYNTFKQFIFYKKNIEKIRREIRTTKPKLILWEATKAIPDLPSKIHDFSIPIFAIPHNIESLVFNQKTFFQKNNPINSLKSELSQLELCSNIFVISSFDFGKISNQHKKLKLLSYYPPNIGFFKDIRKKRERTKGDFYLILGSASNPPTYSGMKELLIYLTSKDISNTFIIAGNGTETFNKFVKEGKNFELLGLVDIFKLEYLFLNCKAIIINQPTTSGLILRLIECQISGIPIIGNLNYFEDYKNEKGFYLYNNWDSLSRILSKSEFESPSFPLINLKEVNCFVKELKLLLN